MEWGTDWEYEAVRDQWAAIERQRRGATRLLAGGSLGLFAVVLLLLAATSEACIGDGGIPPQCVTVATGPIDIALTLTGVVALGSGLWLCWSALRE